MSAADIDPVWLERQLARFQPSDMDAAVQLMRGYDRRDREAARRDATHGSAA